MREKKVNISKDTEAKIQEKMKTSTKPGDEIGEVNISKATEDGRRQGEHINKH